MSACSGDPAVVHAASLLARLGGDVVREPRATAGTLCAGGDEVHVEERSVEADWAASGAMWLTGLAGGPPLLPPGSAASAARGALLAFELLSARAGQRVSLDGHRLLGEHAAALGLERRGPSSAGGAFRLLPTADGMIGLSLPRPSDLELLPALVGRPVVDDPWEAVLGWVRGKRTEPAVAWAQQLGLAAAAVPPPDAPPDVQLAARGAHPFRLRDVGRCAPPARSRAEPPLVVDLTSLWAGPLCAHLLGLAGARVVKVESTARPDGARQGSAAFYDLLHAGHESVALDLGQAADVAVLRRLLHRADVVLESARPRAMAQLGIDPAAVVAAGRGRTWVSITAYGRSSPWSNRVGFGDDTAAAAGLVAVDPGTGTVVPVGDAIADPLAGMHAAVAALASITRGGGRVIDVALRDVAAMTLTTDQRGTAARSEEQPGRTPVDDDGHRAAAAHRAAGSRPVATSAVAVPGSDGAWRLGTPRGHVRVDEPWLRAAAGAAAAPGADTDAVLAELAPR